MSKRGFRSHSSSSRGESRGETPEYPTLDRFDEGRRSFLAKLGWALLGAGVAGAGISACGGDRVVGGEPDLGGPAGVAPLPDAKIDQTPPDPDGGVAPMPDARVEPDVSIAGGAPMPDARVDRPDAGASGGDAILSDAKVGGGDARSDAKR